MNDCRDPFSSHLFVGRDLELHDLVAWVLDATVPRRLKTIAASPGYGKTWLLCKLVHQLSNRGDLFIMHVQARNLASLEKITKWLESVIEEARSICPQVRKSDPSDTLEGMISQLLEALCQHCQPELRPILIVDGLDELLKNERELLERYLLEPCWRNSCLRMVISLRDEFSLSSHNLRRGEHRTYLAVFPPPDGQAQLNKRIAEDGVLSLQDLLPLALPYLWTHPYINTYLYETVKKKKSANHKLLLTTDELKQSWQSLIQEKLSQKIFSQKQIEQDLWRIAREDTWTQERFAALCNCSRGEAYDRIQGLIALSLVSSERQRYKVVDGIREILRAY